MKASTILQPIQEAILHLRLAPPLAETLLPPGQPWLTKDFMTQLGHEV
jgi:hypothetical protein